MFNYQMSQAGSPYGYGHASTRIINHLENLSEGTFNNV